MDCPNKWISRILSRLTENQTFQHALNQASNNYQLKTYNIMGLTPEKILQLYSHLNSKFYHNSSNTSIDSWLQNQLRVFVWVLVCFLYLQNRHVSSMTSENWQMLSLAFNFKDPNILQFQSKFLLKSSTKSKKWTQEESMLLSKIVSQRESKNKWNQVAKTLFITSDKRYFRTPKQCRQQWINHLDPSKLRTSWNSIEDFELIQSVMKNGKKWSKVAKDIGQKRTQHMVKNRFKSLLNFQKKRLGQQDDQELLLKKMYQRLQSCQALKKLQESRKELKEMVLQKNSKILQNQLLQQSQLILPQSTFHSLQHEKSWVLQENIEIKDIQINIEQKPIFRDNECVDFFFQEPSFPHY